MTLQNNKKVAYRIIRELYKNKNSLSVTLAGSYSEHFDFDRAGDVDIIIICKNLNKKYFNDCLKKTRSLKRKIFRNRRDVIVNSTFGPIKFYKKNSVVFHLMIYDLKSHIEHTIKSPFTCYDWERSKIYLGKSLKELSPVYTLQLRDFYEARRSTKEYLKDILNNKISYREYDFEKNKIKLRKKYFKIDKLNQKDFIYHTIKFLLVNLIKFEKNLNNKISNSEIYKKFYKVSGIKKDLEIFKKLRNLKNKKSSKNIQNSSDFAIKFINKYNNYINKILEIEKKLYFVRHHKTDVKSDVFLGQKLNPNIVNKRIPLELKKISYDYCFSSPMLRSMETAKLIYKNQIMKNNLLKEIDYGKVENLNYEKLKKQFPGLISSWNKGRDPKFPGGESTFNVLNRVNKFLKLDLTKTKSKKNILILTHNVFLRCLMGSRFYLQKFNWYKININYLDKLEFISYKKEIRPNINRERLLKIFNKFYGFYV